MNHLVERIIAGAVIIAVGVGCYFWNAYESARSDDSQTLASLGAMKGMLETYSQQYGAYPASDDPFILRMVGAADVYRPLLDDGVTECIQTSRCGRYVLKFTLTTNVFYAKGEHSITPQGLN